MKLTYVRPAMTSLREQELEAVLGPVLLSSVDLSTVQAGGADSAISISAQSGGGGHHPASGTPGMNAPERRR
jgi:hypothetical protein